MWIISYNKYMDNKEGTCADTSQEGAVVVGEGKEETTCAHRYEASHQILTDKSLFKVTQSLVSFVFCKYCGEMKNERVTTEN